MTELGDLLIGVVGGSGSEAAFAAGPSRPVVLGRNDLALDSEDRGTVMVRLVFVATLGTCFSARSSGLIFQLSISSSSTGVMPRSKRGTLFRLYLWYQTASPAIRTTPRPAKTTVSAITRVRLPSAELPVVEAADCWLESEGIGGVGVVVVGGGGALKPAATRVPEEPEPAVSGFALPASWLSVVGESPPAVERAVPGRLRRAVGSITGGSSSERVGAVGSGAFSGNPPGGT